MSLGLRLRRQKEEYGPDSWEEAEELLETVEDHPPTVEETVDALGYWLSDELFYGGVGVELSEQKAEAQLDRNQLEGVYREVTRQVPSSSEASSTGGALRPVRALGSGVKTVLDGIVYANEALPYRAGKHIHDRDVSLSRLETGDDTPTPTRRSWISRAGYGAGIAGAVGSLQVAGTGTFLHDVGIALPGAVGGTALMAGIQGYVDASRDEQKRARIDALVEDAGDYTIDVY